MLTLLIVEDDHDIRAMLQRFLSSKNFLVKDAKDGQQALELLADSNPQLILLDWMLPDYSGPTLIRKIRSNPVHKDIPIIMLTARSEEADKIKGLDSGADDYMTKPVSLQELLARVRALIRRSQGLNEDKVIKKGSLSLNPENNELKIQDKSVKIGLTEFRLLHYLMRTPDRLHTRSQLLDQVWSQGTFIEERTVDVHILRLRKILKPYGVDSMVQTVHGAGYRFSEMFTE
ncbi:MAG: response regulator [Methylococcales bacterium]